MGSATAHWATKSQTLLRYYSRCKEIIVNKTGKISILIVQSLSSVQLFVTPMGYRKPGFPVHHQLSEFAQTQVHWVGDAIQLSHSVIPFFFCPHSFPASGSFPVSQLFASDGQRIGFSASTSVLPMNTQDWSPLGWTGWISLQSKGLSRIFSNTTKASILRCSDFFTVQFSNSYIPEKP